MPAYSTQIVKETLYVPPNNNSRSSQIVKEILYSSSGLSRVSQFVIETLYSTPTSITVPTADALVSQIVMEVLRNSS